MPWSFLPLRILLFRGADGLVVLALWATALALLWWAARPFRNERSARRLIALQGLTGLTLCTVAPVLLSSDPIAYTYYGAVALLGGDPWHPPGAAVVAPVLTDAMHQLYGDHIVPSIYGPAFVAIEATLYAPLRSAPVAVPLLLQRFVMLAAALLVTALLPPERRARWALDPLVLFAGAFDAHNDVLFLAVVAAALRTAGRDLVSASAAGVGFAVAGAMKIVGVFGALLVPLALPAAIVATIAFALAVPQSITATPHAAASAPFLRWDAFPLWALVAIRAAIAAIVAGLGWRWARSPADRAVVVTAAATLLIPVVQPWYVLWTVLLASRAGVSRAISVYVGALEAAAVLLYIPAVL